MTVMVHKMQALATLFNHGKSLVWVLDPLGIFGDKGEMPTIIDYGWL